MYYIIIDGACIYFIELRLNVLLHCSEDDAVCKQLLSTVCEIINNDDM